LGAQLIGQLLLAPAELLALPGDLVLEALEVVLGLALLLGQFGQTPIDVGNGRFRSL